MMHKTLALLFAACGLAVVAISVEAKNLPPLTSVTVKLPDNFAPFPPGPNVEAANNNCRSCHSTEMVLYQPAMTRAAWEAEVNKMRNVYKAPVDPKDVAAIADYLTSIKGAP